MLFGALNSSELEELQSYMQRQTTMMQCEEDDLDHEVLEIVDELAGYPRSCVLKSVEERQMNDAGTCYHLIAKNRRLI